MMGELKTKNLKVKNIAQSLKLLMVFTFLFSAFTLPKARAQEETNLTILYTGATYSMLYHCHCPIEPDGGVARRATLVEKLRKENPNTILVDAGDFFGGGQTDDYTQNSELDKKRTEINLASMELMNYDATCIGSSEFNFGKDFLQSVVSKTKIPYLSSNIKLQGVKNYILKEVSGVKLGIIGLTAYDAVNKAGNIEYLSVGDSFKSALESLKKEGAQLIIVLSNVGSTIEKDLIDQTGGVDVLISTTLSPSVDSRQDNAVIVKASRQGRRLGKLFLKVKEGKIVESNNQELRLSSDVKDDPAIAKILPKCFGNNDCLKDNMIGICKDAATLGAACEFTKPNKVELTIILPKDCFACGSQDQMRFFKGAFPGLAASYLYYPQDNSANKLIKNLKISTLPAYIFGKEIQNEPAFKQIIKDRFEERGDKYLLKPEFSGVFFLLERQKIKDRIDLFVSLYDKNTPKLLEEIKQFGPQVHFLAAEENGLFSAKNGEQEVEEYLRGVCIQKYQPQVFWRYITCRSKNLNSSWWEDCLGGEIESAAIKSCARGKEGGDLLKENIKINKEIKVMNGPIYLLDNQETFGTAGEPSAEEFKKIFKR